MTGPICTISKKVEILFFTSMLIVLISVQAGSAYGGAGKYPFKKSGYFEKELPGQPKTLLHPVPDNSKKSYFSKPAEKEEAIFCGVVMQDSVVGYTKSSTNNQIFYLLTIKNTGTVRDSFNFSYTSTSTPLYTYLETVGGTTITKTPGIEPGGSYSFIIRFVVPNGSPAQTTNYTNLVATSSVCGAASTDTTHLLTHLYSGKPTTGDSCDVGITKTADVGTVTAGNTITYTISLLNNLPGGANDVFVIDTLSSTVVYQSSYVSVIPSGGAYSLTYNSTTHAVQFKYLKTLGQNQPITIVIKVKPGCTAVPSVANKVLVSSSTYDNKASNDTSSVTTAVTTAFSAPTASGVTSCYNSSATISASGGGSRTGYEWYLASTGGSLLYTGQNYTTPVLNTSATYYVGYYNLDTTTCQGPRTSVAVTVIAAPVITGPTGTSICPNDAASFTVSSTGTSLTYQWQQSSNGGGSWSNLTNSTFYSGVTTATFTISSATYSMNGYQYRCNVAAGGCANAISSSTATLTVRKSYTWLGVNTNWDDPVNWCSGVPDSSSDVTIPSGLTYYPIITATASTHNIYTGSSTTVTLNSGTIRIFGIISNNGLFDARTGTVNMKGSAAQSIAGSMFNNKTILNLVDGNTYSSGLSVSSAPADTLKITGTLSFGNTSSILNTGDNLTLVSDSLGTAIVGKAATGNSINGNAIVERYINIGTVGARHGKSWQFLSAPVSGQTIKESWMEGGNTPDNYGTMLSGPAGTAAGFDRYSVAPSVKYYNYLTNSWTGISSPDDLVNNPLGYFVFVRGDRTVTATNQPATNTTLRAKGTLALGTLPTINITPDYFQSIGNPYASPIDFTALKKSATVDDKFYTWDPYLYGVYGFGGYQVLSNVNGWKPVPGGTSAYPSGIGDSIIQSGQAFFVHATSSGMAMRAYDTIPAATITFTEDAKVGGGGIINFARKAERVSSSQLQALTASLFTGPTQSDLMADGNAAVFGRNYSDKFDHNDALKIANSGENFGLKTAGKLLSIDARGPLTVSDTLYYNMSNLAKRTYQLRFAPENLQATGLQAFLIDGFLKTETPVSLSDSSFVDVAITSNAASSAANRFMVVFRQMSSLPIAITSVIASHKNSDNIIQWSVQNENGIQQYEVEKSTDGTHFNQMSIVNALNNGVGNYNSTDENVIVGTNFYRVKIVSMDGEVNYSPIVKVINDKTTGSISVYPNPIKDGTIHLQLNNQPSGIYKIKLYNSVGQELISKNITHTEGSSKESVNCGNLPTGIYQLEISKPDGTADVIKVIK